MDIFIYIFVVLAYTNSKSIVGGIGNKYHPGDIRDVEQNADDDKHAQYG